MTIGILAGGGNILTTTVKHYVGNSSLQTIVVPQSLLGGWVVLGKNRDGGTSTTANPTLWDSTRGLYWEYNLAGNETEKFSPGDGIWGSGGNFYYIGGLDSRYNNLSKNYSLFSWTQRASYLKVVNYSGTGVNNTISHGLGVAPDFYFILSRGTAGKGALLYHKDTGNTKALEFSSTGGALTDSTYWNNTSPTGTVFSLGSNALVNQSGVNYTAYCFASKAGESFFTSYIGTGTTSGATVACGFPPNLVMVKDSNNNNDWIWYYKINGTMYKAASNALSATTATPDLTFSSTGFQVVGTTDEVNKVGRTYIVGAWA